MRLRYKTRPADYAEIVNATVKIIRDEFLKPDKMEFCYPHSEVSYSLKKPPTPSAAPNSPKRGA